MHSYEEAEFNRDSATKMWRVRRDLASFGTKSFLTARPRISVKTTLDYINPRFSPSQCRRKEKKVKEEKQHTTEYTDSNTVSSSSFKPPSSSSAQLLRDEFAIAGKLSSG